METISIKLLSKKLTAKNRFNDQNRGEALPISDSGDLSSQSQKIMISLGFSQILPSIESRETHVQQTDLISFFFLTCDFIQNLENPKNILGFILTQKAQLPITMVLSRRWRNLFTAIPKLHFDASFKNGSIGSNNYEGKSL